MPCANAVTASVTNTRYGARQQATVSVPAGHVLMLLRLGVERIRRLAADRFGLTGSIPMGVAVTFVSRSVVALMMREHH